MGKIRYQGIWKVILFAQEWENQRYDFIIRRTGRQTNLLVDADRG